MDIQKRDSAVLSSSVSREVLKKDVEQVINELNRIGIHAENGSIVVSLKPTINSNNGG